MIQGKKKKIPIRGRYKLGNQEGDGEGVWTNRGRERGVCLSILAKGEGGELTGRTGKGGEHQNKGEWGERSA